MYSTTPLQSRTRNKYSLPPPSQSMNIPPLLTPFWEPWAVRDAELWGINWVWLAWCSPCVVLTSGGTSCGAKGLIKGTPAKASGLGVRRKGCHAMSPTDTQVPQTAGEDRRNQAWRGPKQGCEGVPGLIWTDDFPCVMEDDGLTDKAWLYRSSEKPVQMDSHLPLHAALHPRWKTMALFIWMRPCGQVPAPVTSSQPAGGHWGSGCG